MALLGGSVRGTGRRVVSVSVAGRRAASPRGAVGPSPVWRAVLFAGRSVFGWGLGRPLVPLGLGAAGPVPAGGPGPPGRPLVVWSVVPLQGRALVGAAASLLRSPAGGRVGLAGSLLGAVRAVRRLPVLGPAAAAASVLGGRVLAGFGRFVLLGLLRLRRPVGRLASTATPGAGLAAFCRVPSRFPTLPSSGRDGFT